MCNLEKIFMSWILAWGIHGSYTSVYPCTRKGKGVISGSVDLFPAVNSVSPHYPCNESPNEPNESEWNLH